LKFFAANIAALLLQTFATVALAAPAGRVLEFPARSVGDLAAVTFNKNDGTYDVRYFAKARGKVVLDDKVRCGLVVNYDGAQDLTFINRLASAALVYLRCNDFEITDKQFQALTNLAGLKVLEIAQADITDTGFKHVCASPQLEELIMPSCLIRGGSFDAFKCIPHLRRLVVDHNRLNDACLSNLRYLKELCMIRLQACEIGDAGIANLRFLPLIADVDIAQNKGITDKSIDTLLACPKIFRLDLKDTSITPAGLARLSTMPRLTQLTYRFNLLSAAENARLRKQLPHCQLIDAISKTPIELFEK
jgi:hypothetical protein